MVEFVKLDMYQGANFNFDLDFPEGFLVSTMSFEMQIREQESRNSDLILDVTPYFDVIIEENKVSINVPFTIIEGLSFSKGFYDIFVFNSDNNNRFPLFKGVVVFDNQVTYDGGV